MEEQLKREKAWVGDAVLALFAREWILRQADIPVLQRATFFKDMTSNHFLASVGQPTQMEADIGEHYEQHGLASAFAYIEERFMPVFEKQRRNRRAQGSWRTKRG